MAITAGMVKELRETTGAGMMDCKKALTETNGDMEAAVELLKKSGAAKMAKKAARIAAEGICRVAVDGNKAVVVEVNSETDFVAKNEVFQAFVQDVADKALASGACGGVNGEDVQTLLDGGLTEEFADKTLKIGEKLSFRRFETVEGDCVASYIHGGGRIGVRVAASGASDAAANRCNESAVYRKRGYLCRRACKDERDHDRQCTERSGIPSEADPEQPVCKGSRRQRIQRRGCCCIRRAEEQQVSVQLPV